MERISGDSSTGYMVIELAAVIDGSAEFIPTEEQLSSLTSYAEKLGLAVKLINVVDKSTTKGFVPPKDQRHELWEAVDKLNMEDL